MKITVTQEHIDNGQRGSCDKDPIALALKDAGCKNPWVAPDRIEVEDGFGRVAFELPPEVKQFITDFDQIRCVDPFTFELGGG